MTYLLQDILAIDRVQLSRKKGAKLPPHTLIVDRRNQFGNHIARVREGLTGRIIIGGQLWVPNNKEAVDIFQEWLGGMFRAELRQTFLRTLMEREIKHLACWCSLDEPYCHAEVWLEFIQGKLALEQF